MHNRLYSILVIFLFCITIHAQNQFVYLRFDESIDNISLLKRKIAQLRSECDGKFILYYDGKFYQNNEVDILLEQKNFLQNVCNYIPIEENAALSAFFEETLHEIVSQNNLLRGADDDLWSMTFIMHIDDSRDDICQLIDIHSFLKRNIALSFINYTTDTYFEHQSFSDYSKEIQLLLNFK